jgi:hypothetical protein
VRARLPVNVQNYLYGAFARALALSKSSSVGGFRSFKLQH